MPLKVSIEQAQLKMNQKIGEGKFKIIHWEGASKPVIIECLKCGEHIVFTKGSSIYTNRNVYNFEGECLYCKRRHYAEINIHSYKMQIKRLQNKIDKKEYSKNGEKMVSEKIEEIKLKIIREENIISEQLEKEKAYQKTTSY